MFAGTEFSTIGLLNADTVTSVTLTSPGAVATAPVSGSPYPITPSAAVGSGLGNYTISYFDGDLGVTPAAAVIVVTGYAVTYDALPHTATGTATGVFGEDLSAGLDLSATTHTLVGAYLDTWTFSDPSGNYAPDASTVANSISPAPLTITANDRTKTYGQTVVFAGTEFGDERPARDRHRHERDPHQRRRRRHGDRRRQPLSDHPLGRGRHRASATTRSATSTAT